VLELSFDASLFLLSHTSPSLQVLTWCQKTINHEYLVDGKIQGKDIAHSGCPARFGITTLQQLVA
jgi:hypothetical protein